MIPIYGISSAETLRQTFTSERETVYGLSCRLLALILLSLVLTFSVFFVPQKSPHLKIQQGQEEILQGIPTISTSEALVFEGFTTMTFAVYFLLYSIYWLYHQHTVLTCALKESLSVLTFLRNPFYVFTSIHAP